jgi:hypothetical protein
MKAIMSINLIRRGVGLNGNRKARGSKHALFYPYLLRSQNRAIALALYQKRSLTHFNNQWVNYFILYGGAMGLQ